MADNTTIQRPTTVGDNISTEDLGGVKLPRSKMVLGDHGVDSGDVAPDNPLPVYAPTALDVAVTGVVGISFGGSSGTSLPVSVIGTPSTVLTSYTSSAALPVSLVSTGEVTVNVDGTVGVTYGGSSGSLSVNVVSGNVSTVINGYTSSAALPVNIVTPGIVPVNVTTVSSVTVTTNNVLVQSGTNQSAVISFGGEDGVSQVIGGVAWSYSGSGTLTPGNLMIQDGDDNIVFSVDITNLGPGFMPFNPPITTGVGNGMTITLSGVSSVLGKVNALSYWTQ